MNELILPKSVSVHGSEKNFTPNGDHPHTDPYQTIAERNPKFVHPDTLADDDPKKQILGLIGHGHLDPVWLWDYSRGKARMLHTAQSALHLMETNDDFVYTQSSPAFLQLIERVDKGLHNEIVLRSHEGRWDNVGGGWVEPDMNLPVASSLQDSMRHAQRYYADHIGVTPRVALAADAFGHPHLQKLLKKSGYAMYFHMRPQRGEEWLPEGVYEWENRDGDVIHAERIFEEYSSGSTTTKGHIIEAADQLRSPLDIMSLWYGVGNHGGGPTQEILDLIKDMQDNPELPQLLFLSTHEYYDLVRHTRSRFPRFTEELQAHARGGYSLGVEGNLTSRRVENLRDSARRFSVMANWLYGTDYPKTDYAKAEQSSANQDFHDKRVRCIVASAEQRIDDAHGHAADIFTEESDIAVLTHMREVRILFEQNTEPYVASNPHAFPVREFISVEENNIKEGIQIVDAYGVHIPHQRVTPHAVIKAGKEMRKHIGFMLDIPAGGHRVFKMRHQQSEIPQYENNLNATPEQLENERMKISFDTETGAVTSLIDKELNYDFIYTDSNDKRYPGFIPVICDEVVQGVPVDTWGHKKDQWRPEEKDVTEDGTVTYEAFQLSHIEVIDKGPVKATVRVTSTYQDPNRHDNDGNSKLVIDYSLYSGTGRLDMDMKLDWHEKHKMLKFLIPVGLESRQTTAEGVFQTEVRNQEGTEWPTRNFIDVSGRRRDKHEYVGMTFMNNGLPSYSMDNRNLYLTIARSPDVATHDPATNDEGKPHEHTDQGRHWFRFALQTHPDDLDEGKAIKAAQAFNKMPAVELQTYNPGGTVEPEISYYSVDKDNLQIDSIKLADDLESDDAVITIYETNGQRTSGTITFFGKEIPVTMQPGELRVIRIPKQGCYFETDIPELVRLD